LGFLKGLRFIWAASVVVSAKHAVAASKAIRVRFMVLSLDPRVKADGIIRFAEGFGFGGLRRVTEKRRWPSFVPQDKRKAAATGVYS